MSIVTQGSRPDLSRNLQRRPHLTDLVGTDLPGGSYRDRTGHHRLSIGTIRIASANDRYLRALHPFRSSDQRLLSALWRPWRLAQLRPRRRSCGGTGQPRSRRL
jgi:hypothetical protein